MGQLCLVVQTGPAAGQTVAIGSDPVTIGRGDGQTLQLSDPAVSRHHLTLTLRQEELLVHEVAGINPVWTLAEGRRVTITPGYRLRPEMAFTLGGTTITVQRAEAHPKGRPATVGPATLEMDAGPPAARGDPLASLAALGEKLARCESLQAVFRAATSWAVEALPVSRALLLTPDGSDILGAAAQGTVADIVLSRALLDRVRSENRAFLVGDVNAEPDLADRRSVRARNIAGAMAAPAQNLVFYCEWSRDQALAQPPGQHALLLLICAAHLVSALGESASERSQLQAAERTRRGTPQELPRMAGSSAAIQRLQVFIERVASTKATVLLHGESGTGKELVAQLLHALSPRREGPLVAVNCAAIPEGLLESELFGHEKGAFTGAVARHEGVFARADGGTLFLDEIGEMSPSAQARMLRVLETQRFTRVGGTEERSVDVRLVAATHRDLRAMVAEGAFREDLLYRLSVIKTEIPPLRARSDDIPVLVRHFADQLGEAMGRRIHDISPPALEALQRYRWPGNVRELRNVIERALVLGDGPVLDLDDLPPELVHAGAPAPPEQPTRVASLAEVERNAIAAALSATGGNKARAAALLGIDRTTLYRKLKDHGI